MRIITRGKEDKPEVMALAVQANARMKGRDSKNKSACTHYNKEGHDEAGCFELIGYPEWWGERLKNFDKVGGQGRGQYRAGGLSKELWQTLVELLNTSKVTPNESMTGKTKLDSWILDSGASNHM
ncbi:hypothetical protein L195_g033572, partial [Trifolium pratense]